MHSALSTLHSETNSNVSPAIVMKMNTPIYDFVTRYLEGGTARLHMPGHKGVGPLGCEARDITEIAGADELYAAGGIIAESEKNASLLFGSGATFYGTEGSSQCMRAMLYLAMAHRDDPESRPVALAARNAHKSLLYAAALCDFDVEWVIPDGEGGRADSICSCLVTPGALAHRLDAMDVKPFCVLVTSPDYLGGMQDIRSLSEVCHARGVPLLVDNAHGACLRFLPESRHPLDLGADMCCDSAHKTLPVLTGGAYLHIAKAAGRFAGGARDAMALFGSTSPSYLIMQSLDLCNARLAGDYPHEMAEAAARVSALKARLSDAGLDVQPTEPMKLTLAGDGYALAEVLRRGGVECEYADRDYVVMMFTPDNREADFDRIAKALRDCGGGHLPIEPVELPVPARAMSIRQAMFAPSEEVPVSAGAGRVCAAPAVSCPPAIPIVVSGEIITPGAVKLFKRYGIDRVRVVR